MLIIFGYKIGEVKYINVLLDFDIIVTFYYGKVVVDGLISIQSERMKFLSHAVLWKLDS